MTFGGVGLALDIQLNFEGIAQAQASAGPSKTAGAVGAVATTGRDARTGMDSPSLQVSIA
jgi:hypothetical protein